MVSRNLLRKYDLPEGQLERELEAAFAAGEWLPPAEQDYRENKLLTGRVRGVTSEAVLVDIGYKSEGAIELREWFDEAAGEVVPPRVGDEVQLLLQVLEDESGAVVLSYRKARWQKAWDGFLGKYKEGDVVSGTVGRKIKGGLLVNVGVNVFLPASQLDVRRVPDVGQFIGKTIECKIVSIDEARRSVVVSRRKLLEDQREEMKKKLLAEIEPGQVRKGAVKNIAEFGAFVDLGGSDGLLHITDMAWHRVSDPRDVVQVDQEVEVLVLRVDKEKERIALGLKQTTPSPWDDAAEKYRLGSRHQGEVANLMTYGAFVKLGPGLEGLVHISEMSWTRRLTHPSELVAIGDVIEVQVLNINKDKQEISLGMKQVMPNPWDKVAERYPHNTVVTGVVRSLANYGAFIEIEEGIDGLLHVSDMSHVKKVSHPSEVVQKGDKVTCVVLNVDQERKRIALGLKQMTGDPWETEIPGRYKPGETKKGKVTKLTNFGVFVELEPGLEGLLHISELAGGEVEKAGDVVKVGDDIEVKILRVDVGERRIGLSQKQLGEARGDETERAAPDRGRPQPRELRGGTGAGAGTPFITLPREDESVGGGTPPNPRPLAGAVEKQ
jgi:small subunit ribosomal protein S1